MPSSPTPAGQTLEITASRVVPRIVGILVAVEVVLVVMDLTFAFHEVVAVRLLHRLFNMARGDGLSAWFSASQALVVAMLLLALALIRNSIGWAMLSGLFAWVSADDALVIHERAETLVRDSALGGGAEWSPSSSWQLVFGPPFAVAALMMAWFLWRRLDRPLWPWFVGSLALFATAILVDFVEGVDGAIPAIAQRLSVGTYTVDHLSGILEKTLELVATTLLLGVFSSQLLRSLSHRQLVIRPHRADSPPLLQTRDSPPRPRSDSTGRLPNPSQLLH